MLKNHIPNLLTLANLLCGLFIIISAFQLQFVTAIYFAVAALVFDFFDGTAARYLKSTSTIGKELDSMADNISFGAAPALVLFNYWINEIPQGFEPNTLWQEIIPYFALIIAAAAGYRLAKFNISEQSNDYFKGLPTPAFALACFALPLAAEQMEFTNTVFNKPIFIVSFIALGSYLMVGDLKLFSLKIGSKNKTLNRIRIALIIVCILLIAGLQFFGVFLCLVVYILFSLATQKQIT
jgi:CDP-diacylglycerol--serine O-phosphatidyltransferase